MLNNYNFVKLDAIQANKHMDLHIHTQNSDGELSVSQVLKIAQRTGLQTISITDHNTLNAYSELENLNVTQYYKGEIITGVEINLLFNGQLLEGLAYGFDLNKLQNLIFFSDEYYQKMQRDIAHDLCELALYYGLVCDESFIHETLKNGVCEFFDELHSHYENQEYIKKHKLARLRDFYRNHFTNPKGLFYIDFYKYFYTFKDMKKIINDAGGVLVLAHPIGTYMLKNKRKIIKQLSKKKLIDGIEVIHFNMDFRSTNFCYRTANKYNFVKTCGSDFHKRNHVMGYANKSELKTIITK